MTAHLRLNFSALRALETAERCRSFTLAAHELNVTHSAVSHQIRQIESLLEVSLFTRRQTQMIPSATCTQLAQRVRQSLVDIEFALLEAKHVDRQQRVILKIGVMADFANVWLIPELETFYNRYPHLDLSITVRNTVDTPEAHELDLGIWHRSIDRNGFQSTKLPDDQVIAVCTPAFFAKHGAPKIEDLVNVPLLRFARRSWREFFHAADIAAGDPEYGPIFDDASALLSAALAGQGVAMLRERLTRSYLRDGALVQVGSTQIRANLAYYLCWREDNPKQEAIRQFIGWLEKVVQRLD
ncbi:LysR substrate-binding domain-containing protein [Burkholderia multivorans]|uniref:LysR substrate-binding domain-containing protein n=1 Tax=Burkholderia multivorans TaxID=87883 RepID=UPI001C2105E0|nr:LysR substrate-binding domain-containing protein [Burkholderia multivorans]MBU9413524.1 LysR family transcriptional regulator [Burkholderia multivorans]